MELTYTVFEHYVASGDVEALLTGLAEATGSQVEWEKRYVVRTDSARVVSALKALFGPDGEQMEKAQQKKVREQSKIEQVAKAAQFKLMPGEPKEIKAWRVMDENGNVLEQLTIDEKNKRLAAGEFDEGQIIHHPRAGRQRVTGPRGSGQGLTPEA